MIVSEAEVYIGGAFGVVGFGAGFLNQECMCCSHPGAWILNQLWILN